MKRNNIH